MSTSFLEKMQIDNGFCEHLKYFYQEVIDINTMVGEDYSDPQTADKYYILRCREAEEMLDAVKNENPVKFVDALLDILVVTSYEAYCRSGKVPIFDDHKDSNYTNGTLVDLYNDFKRWHNVGGRAACFKVLSLTEEMLFISKCSFKEAIRQVLNSNKSKFPKTTEVTSAHGIKHDETSLKEVLDIEVNKIIGDGDRYSDVYYEIVKDAHDNDRVVFWANDEYGELLPKPKYVKWSGFSEPDFEYSLY